MFGWVFSTLLQCFFLGKVELKLASVFPIYDLNNNINHQSGVLMYYAFRYIMERINNITIFKNVTFVSGEEIQYESPDLLIEVGQKVLKSDKKFSYSTIGAVNGFLTKALTMMKAVHGGSLFSYTGASHRFEENAKRFSHNFFRSTPSNYYRALAFNRLLMESSWSYFAIIASNGPDGAEDTNLLTTILWGVEQKTDLTYCIDPIMILERDYRHRKDFYIDQIKEMANTKKLKALVLLTTASDTKFILKILKENGLNKRFKLLFFNGLPNYIEVTNGFEDVLENSMSIDFDTDEDLAFRDYVLSMTVQKSNDHPYTVLSFESLYQCNIQRIIELSALNHIRKKHDKSCNERELKYKEHLGYYPNTPVQYVFQAVLGVYHMTVDYLLLQCSKNSTNAYETYTNKTFYANKTFDTNETSFANKTFSTNKTAHTNENKFIKRKTFCNLDALSSTDNEIWKIARNDIVQTFRRNPSIFSGQTLFPYDHTLSNPLKNRIINSVKYRIYKFMKQKDQYKNELVMKYELGFSEKAKTLEERATPAFSESLEPNDIEDVDWILAGCCHCFCPTGYRHAQAKEFVIRKCCTDCIPCGQNDIVVNRTKCVPCKATEYADNDREKCISYEKKYLIDLKLWRYIYVVLSGIGIVVTLFFITVFIKNNNNKIVKGMGREMCYSIFFGCILLFVVPLVFLAQPTSFFCKIRSGLVPLSFFICFFSMTLNTFRIYRIFVWQQTKKSLKFTSPVSQICFLASNCGVQILLSIVGEVTMISEPTEFLGTDKETVYVHCTGDENLEKVGVSFSLPLVCMILSSFFAFKTRKCPKNFNEAKAIMDTFVCSFALLSFFVASSFFKDLHDFQHEIRIGCFCYAISFVILIRLFGPKVRALTNRRRDQENEHEN